MTMPSASTWETTESIPLLPNSQYCPNFAAAFYVTQIEEDLKSKEISEVLEKQIMTKKLNNKYLGCFSSTLAPQKITPRTFDHTIFSEELKG
jgi:hypothetical protein